MSDQLNFFAFQEKARDYLISPWTSINAPKDKLLLTRGTGIFVEDILGKHYIDCSSQNLTCGYAIPEILEAACSQLSKLHGFDLSRQLTLPAIQCAEKLASYLPQELRKTFFVNSGSEGIESALFMALTYWETLDEERSGIISLKNSYHGSTYLARSLSGIQRVKRLSTPPFPVANIEFTVNESVCCDFLIFNIEKAILQSKLRPIAIILEPIINVGGGIFLPDGCLEQVQAICHKYEILLILDEVFTGVGRTGRMFAFQHENVTPDILVISKGLTNGLFPLGAVSCHRKIYQALQKDPEIHGLRYGHTTSGHASACYTALKTLDYIEQNNLVEAAENLGKILLKNLSEIRCSEFVFDVRGKGLICVIETVNEDVIIKIEPIFKELGLLPRYLGNSIMLTPPLTITQDQIALLSDSIFSGFNKLTKRV